MKIKIRTLLILVISFFITEPACLSQTLSGKSDDLQKDKNVRIFIEGTDSGKPIKMEFLLATGNTFSQTSENFRIVFSTVQLKDGKYRLSYDYQLSGKKSDTGVAISLYHQLSGKIIVKSDKKAQFFKADDLDLNITLKEDENGG